MLFLPQKQSKKIFFHLFFAPVVNMDIGNNKDSYLIDQSALCLSIVFLLILIVIVLLFTGKMQKKYKQIHKSIVSNITNVPRLNLIYYNISSGIHPTKYSLNDVFLGN